jgi:DegV family protein with EDD domain
MGTREFYRRLSRENIFPTTTQPAPGVFADLYNKLAEETDEILVIVISTKLSGTYQSATNAISMVNKPCRIEVIDSMAVVMVCGMLVIKAAEMANGGASLDEIAAATRDRMSRMHLIAYFDTLKYLAMGGRIGKAQGLLGSMLSIKPILTIREGEMAPLTRVRSRAAGIDYLCNTVAATPNIEALAVEHCTSPGDVEFIVERLSHHYPREKIYLSTISSVVGTYAGPDALAVSYIEGAR